MESDGLSYVIGLSVVFYVLSLLWGLFGGYVSYSSKGGTEGGVPVFAHVLGAVIASVIGTMFQYAASLVGGTPFAPILVAFPVVMTALAYGAILVGDRCPRHGPTNPE